ncbi:hypothetical protein EIN_485750 [Entamoeba invadens IP1]|uniref:Flavin reductase like domain-containing protein n=1 Tax=Entamoeba invadens IP1 TaxID=370355 RepID=A0A0A1UAG7_ENTIV|nr:hypothetical protein EIN_485750 [Entamoeba invadens IP1]ELP89183.1 hypothetical protein EIN_485750 [Entamoeba invadens IP1]|eukprot:XP_004255954.1 hypothetical protein EIN_485750 [Entamoeba invadens IP1]
MPKVAIDLQFATRLVNQSCVVIPTVYDASNKRTTGMSAQWQMPIDKKHIALLLGAFSHTGDLITKTAYYVINIPRVKNLDDVDYFGMHHGNEVDKFAQTKFTLTHVPCKNEEEKTPNTKLCIEEALAWVELKLESVTSVADECDLESKLIIGEITRAWADSTDFDGQFYKYENMKKEDKPIHCINETKYATIEPVDTVN